VKIANVERFTVPWGFDSTSLVCQYGLFVYIWMDSWAFGTRRAWNAYVI